MNGNVAPGVSFITFPPFRLDLTNQQLWHGAQRVAMKPKAFSILRYLLQRPRQLVTKQELLAEFWAGVHVTDAVLKTHLGEIRQALGDEAKAPRFIETAHRLGYRFIGGMGGESEAPTGSPSSLPASRPSARAGSSFHVPHFVGRGPELRALQESWRRALGGARQAVFITGEPGVGKTVLVSAFLESLRSSAESWVGWGQCVAQYGQGEPFLPFFEALQRLCRHPNGELVLATLRRHAPLWVAQMPALTAPLVTAPVTSEGHTPRRMLRELVEAMEALAERRPLVLLLEDLHWADHSTIDALAYLIRRSDPARLLLLATYRPPQALGQGRLAALNRDLTARGHSVELQVPPMTEQSIAEYLDERFPGNDLPESLVALLHHRTEGNALFMVKVVDDWLERKLLAPANGRCELMGSLEELSRCVPSSLVRMIERDIDDLDTFERSVLEAGSVSGNDFSISTLAAALLEGDLRVEAVCVEWARRGRLLKLKGRCEWRDGTVAERCEFLHVLYQQVAYERIGVARRSQLHRRIGERLEAAYGEDAGSLAPALASHFLHGQAHRRAVHYLRLAGEQALRRSAYHEAIAHFRRALDALRHFPEDLDKDRLELELYMALGPPLCATKGYAAPEVEKAYGRAQELCEVLPEGKQQMPVMAAIANFHFLRGTYRKWLAPGARVLERATADGDAVAISQASLLLGVAHHHLGEHGTACAHLERSIAAYHPEQHDVHARLYIHEAGVVARCFLAISHVMLGYPERALGLIQLARSLAEQLRDPFAMAFALGFASYVHDLRREPEAARECAELLATLSGDKGFDFSMPTATFMLGRARVLTGELAEGVELLRQGWRELAATGAVVYATYWSGVLAEALGELGSFDEALALLATALPGGSYAHEEFWEAELYRIAGDLLVRAQARPGADASIQVLPSAFASAETCFQRALEVARQQKVKGFELRAARSLARYWQRQGRSEDARALLADIYGWFTEGLDTLDLVEARALLDELSESARRTTRPSWPD